MMNVLVLRVRCVCSGPWKPKVPECGGKLMNREVQYQQENVDPTIPYLFHHLNEHDGLLEEPGQK
jgi:hypothetical protein